MTSQPQKPSSTDPVDASKSEAEDRSPAAEAADSPAPEAEETGLRRVVTRRGGGRLRAVQGRGGDDSVTELSPRAARLQGLAGGKGGRRARAEMELAAQEQMLDDVMDMAREGGRGRGRLDLPADPVLVMDPASPATIRPRHRGIMALAFLMIILPGILAGIYLWKFAADQYVSVAGFAIRTEKTATPFDFLGAFGAGSSTTSNDMDILNHFVTSQHLVAKLQGKLNLAQIYSRPENDPLYAYDPSGTIEDMVDYWERMVLVEYDNTTGLMKLSVYAFTPEDAQRVAQAVMDESSLMVNELAAVARDDTTKYAKVTLDEAERKLQESRATLTQFRIANAIVDPVADLTAQTSVLGQLNQQLVAAQIELETLKQAATPNDPRVAQVQRRIDIIQTKIAEEQTKVAESGGSKDKGYAELLADYERLKVDNEFAEKAYLTALATYDAALADAQQKQVYLATYEEPTLAEASTAPNRVLTLVAVMLIGFFAWAMSVLIYYALRDRR